MASTVAYMGQTSSMPAAMLRTLGALCALILATTLIAAPASAASQDITITFVRHGESEGNTSGLIDTTVPGPPLTALGEQQAKAVAQKLSHAKQSSSRQPSVGLPLTTTMPVFGRGWVWTRSSWGFSTFIIVHIAIAAPCEYATGSRCPLR
jgi:hypothetical protein